MSNSELNFEIQRKIFHTYSIIFPVLYILTSKIFICILLTIISGITLYLDISKHYNSKIKEFVVKIFGKVLRNDEYNGQLKVSGASYMAMGFLLSGLFFSKGLAITSWLILIISDSLAAIIGKKFGTPILNKKSIIGSVAFFISALCISIMVYFIIGYNTTFFIIILSSFVTTLIEFFSEKININDNFSIPITYALVTTILSLLV